MTSTGNPYHDPPVAAPTDQELLTGERSIRARKAAPAKAPQSKAVDRELDRELAQSMDASDPPSVTQP